MARSWGRGEPCSTVFAGPGKATRETPTGCHQDFRHVYGSLAGQRKVGRLAMGDLGLRAEQGLAKHRGQHVVLAGNSPATLRGRALAQACQGIAVATGLERQPVADGPSVAGIYRRNAMLDDGMGWSLVPWKPVLEQRLGVEDSIGYVPSSAPLPASPVWALPGMRAIVSMAPARATATATPIQTP